MKRFPTAHATHPQWRMAVALVLAQLRAQMALPGYAAAPTLGLLYITDHYAAEAAALLDVLSDERGMGPELESQEDDMRSSIVHWLEELNPKQREVLARRFGLLGYEPATLEDVGREIGLTRERVRQIQVEALRRLRDILTQQGLTVDALFNGD